ncbi:MAG TPA: VOC family protein [Segeticoccus sp.]|uniref:VOC family protein n=1 Tax=Segeticoccus sp. TaxID=2706531 RepID=UPI002D7E5F8F|nr:VOC family protein [Segeticoccus sp.]HET8598923.1 VOC family protein [Segeticoccus sp.]
MPLRRMTGWFGIVLDAPDPRALAHFYERLLGWTVFDEADDWCSLAPSKDAGYNLAFQRETHYVRPVWPAQPGQQQMSVHLDFGVDDLAAATEQAVQCGAEAADHQPQDDVRVMLDPAGHPFCLYLDLEG